MIELSGRVQRVRYTAAVVLVLSLAFMAGPVLMFLIAVATRSTMVDRQSGRPVAIWFEVLVGMAFFALGLLINRGARWVLQQYRAGRTAFGID